MGESFQIGINAFLKKFKYTNAVTQDLWNELTSAWAGHVPDGEKVSRSSMWTIISANGYKNVTCIPSSTFVFLHVCSFYFITSTNQCNLW